MAALAARIGVDTTRVVGMEPVTGEDGRFVEALHEPVTWREGKVQCLHARAGTLPTLAMGDSEGDIRMLESARYAIWIDRGDPQLRRAARTTWWRQECW